MKRGARSVLHLLFAQPKNNVTSNWMGQDDHAQVWSCAVANVMSVMHGC